MEEHIFRENDYLLESSQRINEMANRQKSGICYNNKDYHYPLEYITDKMKNKYDNEILQPQEKEFWDNVFEFDLYTPFDNKTRKVNFSLLYGDDLLGVKHIYNQREFEKEYKKGNNFIPMSETEVTEAIKNTRNVLKSKDRTLYPVYIDFDEDNQPYFDRVIYYDVDKGIFYCIGIQISPNTLNYLHTLFKPTPEYIERIKILDYAYRIENKLIINK